VKVLHLVHAYHPSMGGAELVFQRLSEGFVARYGDDVTVLTTNAIRGFLDDDTSPAGDERLNGVLVRRFRYWRWPLPVLRRVFAVARLARVPFRDYLDALRAGPWSPGMLLAARRADADTIACMGFPFLQMYFGLGPRRPPVVMFGALHIQDDYIPPLVLRAIARCRAYVAFTEFEKATLVRHGIDPALVHVVGPGVDVDSFERADGRAIRDRCALGDSLVVGFIGRQAPYKGIDTLVRAMTIVWDRRPDAHLVLAGSRTGFSAELRRMIDALPRAKRARVTAVDDFPEDEKAQWFAACDVFVTVSTEESFGIVFAEAWAAGKPVIGGRIRAVESVIHDGDDGLLVPCGEPAPLAAAIERLLDDAALRTRMGRRGQARVRADHDWNAVVDKIHAVYELAVRHP
jgi:glycosyltransferase involved in cell wall biosynthesis